MTCWIDLRIALRALIASKLRSRVNTLGVVIGMTAVVALVSIGQGAQAQIAGQMEGIGANLITVTPGRAENHGVIDSGGTARTLTVSEG